MKKKVSGKKIARVKNKNMALILVIVFIAVIATAWFGAWIYDRDEFVLEARIDFYKVNSDKSFAKVDVEIANTTKELFTGLMYRKSMPDTVGMFFIFPAMQEQSFWMKNTEISLDIIYIDNNGKIVTIHKNTEPFSEKSLISSESAQYALEVTAGFCVKNEIYTGDYINISKNKK